MDVFSRRDLGEVLSFVALVGVGGALTYLLQPLIGRSRWRRAAVWSAAWGLGAWLSVSVTLATGGAHQVYRDRATGGWFDTYWTREDARGIALIAAVVAALFALLLPRPQAPTDPGRTRPARARRKSRRPAGG
jgi:hypothetical protein